MNYTHLFETRKEEDLKPHKTLGAHKEEEMELL
jgi:hypothetical protein